MPDAVRNVFVFPGQGAYTRPALAALTERSPSAPGIFAAIDEVAVRLGGDPVGPALLRADPPDIDTLLAADPVLLQLAIFGTSYALFDVARQHDVLPDVLLGHSFGEISALVAAGAYTLQQGAEIVVHRTRVLEAGAPADGAMVALACDAARAEHLLAALGDPWTAVAVDNAPGQVVVSGPAAAVGALTAMAEALRVPAIRLKARWAFHSPQLAPVVAEYAARIAHLRPAPLTVPVFSPILGRFHRADDDFPDHLSRSLVIPVRFRQALHTVSATGPLSFLECGAGEAMSRLVRQVLPDASAHSALDLLGASGAVAPVRAARIPVPVAVPVSAPVLSGPQSRSALFAELAQMYAEALEYPVEVFTEDVALEADLGIDSVKQTELLARAAEHYGLPPDRPEGFRLADHGTMGKVTDYVWSMRGSVPAPVARVSASPEIVVPAQRVPAPAMSGPQSRTALFAELAQMYAEALEYPVEVFTEDVALEADLGIDSVKQTELLARAAEHYGLPPDRPEGFRLADHGTMGKVTDYVWSMRGAARAVAA